MLLFFLFPRYLSLSSGPSPSERKKKENDFPIAQNLICAPGLGSSEIDLPGDTVFRTDGAIRYVVGREPRACLRFNRASKLAALAAYGSNSKSKDLADSGAA